ncbi:MAG: GspH/FimT family pseudopilin [Xanthomonadales bacterium]|jgi:type IV fimbrial biogenesis protein FimT|nr:GspH/FimT family pseudopilin [Xanthomonadales bacterium]
MKIHGHGTGTTVIELMVTLSVAAILLTLAAPSLESFTNRQRMKAAVNALHNDLLAARSQAVYRNSLVTVCPGSPVSGCTGASDWSGGWIVFEDSNGDRQPQESEFLLRHGQPHEAIEIHAPASRREIRFFPDGSTPGSNGSISLCGRGGPGGAKKLVISNIGRIRRDSYPGISSSLCPA